MKNKKALLLTLYGVENYGNLLQAYAVSRILKKNGYECDQLVIIEYSQRYAITSAAKAILAPFYPEKKHRFYKIKNFIAFRKRYLNDRWCRLENLCNLDKNYDVVLVGSDQVWNPNVKIWDEYGTTFLGFIKLARKASISASFGYDTISEEEGKQLSKWIDELDYVSVREISGKDIIKNYTDKQVDVLIDPTMYLKAEEWRELKITSKNAQDEYNKERFVLTYFLGEITEEYRKKIVAFAEKRNLTIININDEMDKRHFSYGPAEFVNLIDKAELVCTDSFHGTVFSMLFQTPFVVFERKDNMGDMSTRLTNLLDKYNMTDRLLSKITEENIFDCDYTTYEEVLENERNKFSKYLQKVMG